MVLIVSSLKFSTLPSVFLCNTDPFSGTQKFIFRWCSLSRHVDCFHAFQGFKSFTEVYRPKGRSNGQDFAGESGDGESHSHLQKKEVWISEKHYREQERCSWFVCSDVHARSSIFLLNISTHHWKSLAFFCSQMTPIVQNSVFCVCVLSEYVWILEIQWTSEIFLRCAHCAPLN